VSAMKATDATPPAPDVETASAAYARRFEGAVGAWFLDVQARATLDLVAGWRGGSVLDVGGGHGQLTGALVAADFTVTVLGSAPGCRERVSAWVDAGRARFEVGDLLHAPWPDRSFDVVLAFRLLPHVPRWRELLAELSRLARAAVVIDYPTRRSLNVVSAPLFGLKRRVETGTRPFAVFSDAEVAAAFAGHDFTATGRRPQFFLPMALHRALGRARISRALERAAQSLGLTRVLGSPVILRSERRQ
jgi:2-polyprenyl-3-methyl-5-hydroxy-6-metoxy-1,4-benzoquinol methylase